MTEQVLPDSQTGGETPPSQRRSTEGEVSQAIDLGWRVAALHALTPTTIEPIAPVSPDMLLNRRSLSAADRLELEVRAIAGVAERAGSPIAGSRLEKLLRLTLGAGESPEGETDFRDEVARLHVVFSKDLWAASDVSGKAYELGNFLSDSWNRVASPKVHRGDPHAELEEIFAPVRVERMKILLDDLQSRVDPVAIHAVSNHLDDWCRSVRTTMLAGRSETLEESVERLRPVERQTIIWRQLLTGDKEPEAWIGQAERAQVRDEFTRQLWGRYRRWWWIGALLALAAGGLGYWYATDSDAAQGVAASALAVLAMFGVTRASMTAALKSGARNWSELMWNRALAAVICRETSDVHELYPPAAEPVA
jgi:hypothetical protein